jgi:ribonucleoside-diphosphate reductase alpha chain
LWGKINGIDLTKCTTEELQVHLKNSPYFEATSNFIDPIAKVKMQGEIQKYVCHSISMTNNLPQHATLASVADVYMEAWKSGCKGATIYREGSRSGVLNTTPVAAETFVQHDAPKRPKDLPCDIFHPSINGEKYIVMVGLMEGKPYEVFALKKVDDGLIPANLVKGTLRKRKSKDWVLLHDDKVIVEDILSEFKIPEYEFATKMISTALRHGASIDFVVKQLADSEGMITDYAKVIARQLKKYITSKEDGTACPSCGQSLVVEAGCKQCKNPECGYGQCG